MQDNIQKRNPVQAYLLDKQGKAQELIYEEIDTVNKLDKILWLHFDLMNFEILPLVLNLDTLSPLRLSHYNLDFLGYL